jgi:hypothetical protein
MILLVKLSLTFFPLYFKTNVELFCDSSLYVYTIIHCCNQFFDNDVFQKKMLYKLIWILAFILVGVRHLGSTIGVCGERILLWGNQNRENDFGGSDDFANDNVNIIVSNNKIFSQVWLSRSMLRDSHPIPFWN